MVKGLRYLIPVLLPGLVKHIFRRLEYMAAQEVSGRQDNELEDLALETMAAASSC